MAVGNGYTTSIRQSLNDKGITNDRISYDPSKGVMVDGNTFYKPEKVYSGTSYTSPTNFATAWNNYSKSQQPSTPSQTYQITPTYQSTQQYQPTQQMHQTQQYSYNPYSNNNTIQNNPYTSQADQVIKQLMEYGQNQQSFDPYSTNSYKAAQAQAQRSAAQNTRATQEAYGSAGFGRSTALGERVAGINNDANEYLMTQVIPQIEAQEQVRRQQEFNNILSSLQPLMNQQNRADSLVQQDFSNRITEGQLTGNYMNPEATALINQLLNLKSDTETNWRELTPEQRTSATQQADVYRNQLASLGYNPDLFGADVRSNIASQNRGLATRTLQGQQLDYQQQRDAVADQQWNQTFEYQQERDSVADQQWQQNYGVTLAQITGYMPDGTPTSAQQQQDLNNLWMVADQTGVIPNQLASIYGLQAGTPTRAAKEFAAQLAIQQQNANSSSTSAAASMMNAQTNRAQESRLASTPRTSGSSSSGGSNSTTKLDAKDSYDAYTEIVSDFSGRTNGFSQSQALEYAKTQKPYLTDTHYKNLIDYILENGK